MSNVPWSSLTADEQRLIYEKYGITGWENRFFTRFNLITGENGAGKSRLLRAMRDLCKEAGSPCIYMDFTTIGKGAPHSQYDAGLDDVLLYNYHFPSSIYEDFIPFIENKSEEFSKQLSQINASGRRAVESRREEINRFLETHLGRKLIFIQEEGGKCCISSRMDSRKPLPFAEAVAEMSPGEKAILYFALALLCVNRDEQMKKSFVLLLDEPEEHLHAKALRGLIEELRKLDTVSSKGTVFIASHSIFLAPYAKFQDIILLENGAVQYSKASLYEDVYRSLVGNSEASDGNLQEMLASISFWCFGNYLMECLDPPTVSGKASASDPQAAKLLEMLQSRGGADIELLDYGGGKWRIAHCIDLYFKEHPDCALSERLKYDVYDRQVDSGDMPESPWARQSYVGANAFELKIPEKRYDLVVLYNVLHEVDVTEWSKTLNFILSLLKNDGVLIFGERMVLSLGERPYGKSGYLVLGETELHELFGEQYVQRLPRVKDDDPTECYVITSPRAISVMSSNVQNAIKTLMSRSESAVEAIIERKSKLDPARTYAFYCQQYINAKHALSLFAEASEEEYLKRLSLQSIISDYNEPKRTEMIRKRAKYLDEAGKACKEWLLKNQIEP